MVMNYKEEELISALNVTSTTLVGFMGDFPRERGNCFSVNVGEKDMRILNFNHENLEELIDRKIIEFPIKVLPLSDAHALIADPRIPDEWYDEKFCTICTPRDLLPPQQRLKYLLEVMRGDVEESYFEFEGKKMMMQSRKINSNVRPGIVYAPWKVETKTDIAAYHNLDEEADLNAYINKIIDNENYGTINLNEE